MVNSEGVQLSAVALWCGTCCAWDQGGWGPLFVGAVPRGWLLMDTKRTCAQCGRQLVRRVRTVAIAQLLELEQ